MLDQVGFVSVEEYLSTSYRPDVDYVDGLLVERNLGDFWHSFLQAALAAYFNGTLRSRHGPKFWAFTEFRTEVQARRRYRIPDVLVLPAGVARGAKFLKEPPWIAIEIKSPDDTIQALVAKCSEYVARGCRYVWLIDPEDRSVMEIDTDGARIRPDPAFHVELNGESFRVDLSEVFSQMDEY